MKLKFKVAKPGESYTIGTLTLDEGVALNQATIDTAKQELLDLGYEKVMYLGYTQ